LKAAFKHWTGQGEDEKVKELQSIVDREVPKEAEESFRKSRVC